MKISFDCNLKMVVRLIEGRVCGKQYTGNTVTGFRMRASSYKSTQHNLFRRSILIKQV